MKTEKQKVRIHFPKVGQRIIRSAFAVACCFCVYYLRNKQGIPFYSCACGAAVHSALSGQHG